MGGSVKETASIDWSIIFDTIASEYGYTWEQFIYLTHKQLAAFLAAIDKRLYDKIRINAAIHGIKIDEKAATKQPSDTELKEAEKATNELLRQRRAAKNGKR